ncbi:MAG TPA: Maf family protein [Xanthomonadales bacterium]|nr:Maf family protein [Xanthomonadales bacterium]
MSRRLILASASPRRLELLTQIGVEVEVLACDVPEQRAPDESPLAYSCRVARAKALTGWQLAGADRHCWVLGADTEVVLDDCVFGKPADADAAIRMLQQLSGRDHQVLTSVALLGADFDEVATCSTAVRFAPMSEAQIRHYVASGEPFGKAGAYAIQGRAAAFIARIEGSYSGVMGLPLFETAALLQRAGCNDFR